MARLSKEQWIQLFVEFEGSTKTLSGFCKDRGVAYQTAKNWSSKLRKAGEYPAAGTGTKSGTGTAKSTGTRSGKSAGKDTPPSKSSNRRSSSKENKTSTSTSTEKSTGEDKPRNPSWFQPGNALAVVHGGYSKHLPPEVVSEIPTYGREELRSLSKEIQLTQGQLLLVLKNKAKWEADEEYERVDHTNYPVAEYEDSDHFGKTVKRKRPDYEGQIERLTRRLTWLKQVHEQLAKKPSMTYEEAVTKRREIIEAGIEAGDSWADIGLQIELYGLELPFTIKARINAELALMEPPEPDDGMTDDDLEKAAKDFQLLLDNEVEEEEARARMVEQLRKDSMAEKSAV
ncbi:MAG: hypothetical protein OIF57_08765 [Marinobacterium sp.]|nr:hypothetical protein [Marinobacterium sp.]